jgi:molecular chaperone GrpE (heat shock protein)
MNHDDSKQPSLFPWQRSAKQPEAIPSQLKFDNQEQFEIPTEAVEPLLEEALPDQEQPEILVVSLFEERFANLEANLLELKSLFEKRIQYDEMKNKAFDTLYEKMKQYEGGFQASLKESMIRSLLLLYDNMVSTEVELSASPDIQSSVSYLRQELLDILYSEDVEPMEGLGEVLTSHRQHVLRTVPTNDPAQDSSIEQVIREGFMCRGKVLRPQSVVVRRYVELANNDNQQSEAM